MYKHSYTAKIGFVKTLDRTCATHGGRYSSAERQVCPKCNETLVVPMQRDSKTGNMRPSLFTEVTLYPQMRGDDRKDFENNTLRSNSLGHFEFKMNLWGKYDAATNTVQPDGRVRYLAVKRTIRVEFNSPPLIRPFTSQKYDGQQRIEMKYNFNSNRGDQIEFLDNIQAAQTEMVSAQNALDARNATAQQEATTPVTTPVTPPVIPAAVPNLTDPAVLQATLMELLQRLAPAAAPTTAPTAAPVTIMAATNVESPVPQESTPMNPPADLDPTDEGIEEGDPSDFEIFPS